MARDNRDLIIDYLYDELPPAEREAFEVSMRRDKALETEVESLRATRSMVRRVADNPAPAPSALLDRLKREARLAANPEPQPSLLRKLMSLLLQPAAGFAMVVAAVVGTGIWMSQGPRKSSVSLPPSSGVALVTEDERTKSAESRSPHATEIDPGDRPAPGSPVTLAAEAVPAAAAAAADGKPAVATDGDLLANRPADEAADENDDRRTAAVPLPSPLHDESKSAEVGVLGAAGHAQVADERGGEGYFRKNAEPVGDSPDPSKDLANLDQSLEGISKKTRAAGAGWGAPSTGSATADAEVEGRLQAGLAEEKPKTVAPALAAAEKQETAAERKGALADAIPVVLGARRGRELDNPAAQRVLNEGPGNIATAPSPQGMIARDGVGRVDAGEDQAQQGVTVDSLLAQDDAPRPTASPNRAIAPAPTVPNQPAPPPAQIVRTIETQTARTRNSIGGSLPPAAPEPTVKSPEPPRLSDRAEGEAVAQGATGPAPEYRAKGDKEELLKTEAGKAGSAGRYEQADQHYKAQRYDLAIREFQGYLSGGEGDADKTGSSGGQKADAQRKLAQSYERTNRLEQAAAEYKALLGNSPGYAYRSSVLVDAAQIEARLGRLESARSLLRQALADPSMANTAKVRLADVERQLAERQATKEAAEKAGGKGGEPASAPAAPAERMAKPSPVTPEESGANPVKPAKPTQKIAAPRKSSEADYEAPAEPAPAK